MHVFAHERLRNLTCVSCVLYSLPGILQACQNCRIFPVGSSQTWKFCSFKVYLDLAGKLRPPFVLLSAILSVRNKMIFLGRYIRSVVGPHFKSFVSSASTESFSTHGTSSCTNKYQISLSQNVVLSTPKETGSTRQCF